MEVGVEAAGFRDQVVRQGIQIGGFKFGGFAPSEDITDDRVLAFEG